MSDIFSNVANEIVVNILSFLPAKDLCSVSLVNKNLWSITQDDYVWQSICVIQFPADYVSEELGKMIAEENVVNETNGKKLYKRLYRHINFIAKERGVCWLDCQQGGGNDHHWTTLEDSQSEFGKTVFLEHVWWFDVLSILKAVLPGTYYVIWRLKVKPRQKTLHDLNFYTAVIEKIEDVEGETTIHEYNHIPHRLTLFNIGKNNDWVEFRLPYKLVVPERKVIDGKLIYHNVHLKIFNYEGFLKTGLWIDYVRLREYDESREYDGSNEYDESREYDEIREYDESNEYSEYDQGWEFF